MRQSHPLDWPLEYPRTARPKKSAFKSITIYRAVENLVLEVNRLVHGRASKRKPSDMVISSNVPLKLDGGISANYQRSVIRDKGVAVYFRKGNTDLVLCCDKFDTVESNLHAIFKTVEAMRGIDRWGVSDFLERSFTGFKALPAPGVKSFRGQWWEEMRFEKAPAVFQDVYERYRHLAKLFHPDNKISGSVESFQVLQDVYEVAKKHYGE